MSEQGGVSRESLTKALQDGLEAKHLIVNDVSGGCGAKFELYICSEKFKGVALLARHRMVQELVKNAGLMEKIHALTIKAWTDEEWEKKKDTIPKQTE